MTVFFTGEGPTDYGRKKYGTDEWEEGSAAKLLRSAINAHTKSAYTIQFVSKNDCSRIRLQRSAKKLKDRGLPCARFLTCIECTANEETVSDSIAVFYCDIDKMPGAKNAAAQTCRKHFTEVQKDIQEAAALYARPCALMMPMKMIENWLLADARAMQKAFRLRKPPALPNEPELLWGDDEDITSSYPKHCMDRVLAEILHCRQTEVSDHMELFNAIAENASIQTLRKKCPISFEPFLTGLLQALKMMNGAS